MRPAVFAILLVSLTAGTASADPTPKRAGVAEAYAIGGSLVGPGLMAAGLVLDKDGSRATAQWFYLAGGVTMVLGPSAGHWYAGKPFTIAMGLRAAGAASAVIGAHYALDHLFCDTCEDTGYAAMMFFGAVAYVVGTFWDIATAPEAARAWNRRHGLEVQVAPTVIGTTRGGTAPALALTGRF